MPEFKDKVHFKNARSTSSTERAVYCILENDHGLWVPKSQIDDDSEVYDKYQEGKLVVSLWIAEEKEILDYASK